MRLSKETIALLKNFNSISNHLRVHPGNELSIMSGGGSIFAKVTVAETFPTEFCIHDLTSFLSILSYMNNEEIEFGENSLKISFNGSTIEYRYSEPSTIIAPPAGKSINVDVYYQFAISAADIIMLSKASGITGAQFIVLKSKDNNVTLEVGNEESGIIQSKQIGVSPLTFNALVPVESFNGKIIPATYTVTLSKMKFLHFSPADQGVPEYWLALNPKSVV